MAAAAFEQQFQGLDGAVSGAPRTPEAASHIRSLLEAAWEESLASLAAYKAEHGHCRVKRQDRKLGRWVSYQRQQKDRMTAERVSRLEKLGFVWDPHEAAWSAMLVQLAAFKAEHGHCAVPNNHPADPKLGQWVSHQRAFKKKVDGGDPNPMITAERVASLDALGFTWEDRHPRSQTIESALTKLPATVSEAQRLTWDQRGRLNAKLRNAFFAEFGLSVRDVRASGAAGIRDTLDRVRRDARWQSSSFRFIKPKGLSPL